MVSYSRVVFASGISEQGDREHFEDYSIARFNKQDAFFSVFDGHSGWRAARYASDYLWENIISTEGFYSDKIEDIIKAIKGGFMKTQANMLGKPCTPPRSFSIG